jgi:nucleoside-diphosphate-sugar epimerase
MIHNHAFNIGVDSENYQVRDLADIVKNIMPKAEVEYSGGSTYDPRNYRVDFSKFGKFFPNFSPKWDARRGAQQLYDAYSSNRLQFDDFNGRKYIRLNQLNYLIDKKHIDTQLRWQ